MYKQHYKLFLEANKDVQHYASHSHHYWPDVTRKAMLDYWDDSAKMVDDKWNYFFSQKIPAAQTLIAEVLNLSKPSQIVFAPNTHEFILRIISCFENEKTIQVLTTDSEFHSFDRQMNRLSENSKVQVDRVATESFEDFEERFIARIKSKKYDLIFLSHVFFNSAVVVKNLKEIVSAVSSRDTLIVIDGYHGFMAVPTDLKAIEDRIFYIAGAYKYAQGGEGCCFMHVPESCKLRPANTGWFAGFSELSANTNKVNYTDDGYRFAGSTMDFSALYRLLAAMTLFKNENMTVERIHLHILKLQNNFIKHLNELSHKHLNVENILVRNFNQHGHFFALELKDSGLVKKLHDELALHNIKTDYRGSRLRFGFGLYQEDCINLNYVKSI